MRRSSLSNSLIDLFAMDGSFEEVLLRNLPFEKRKLDPESDLGPYRSQQPWARDALAGRSPMSVLHEGSEPPHHRGPVRAPQSLAGGILLIALAALALW